MKRGTRNGGAAKSESSSPTTPARRRLTPREHLKLPFLAEFEKNGAVIYKAAEAVGVDPATVTGWKKNDAKFLARFTIIDINCKTKENELLKRSCMISAIEGDPEYLVKDGQNLQQRNEKGEPMVDALGRPILVTVRRRFDGHLRTFLMERRMPEEFSNKIETKVTATVIVSLSSEFASVISRKIPEFCPHCKNHLGLRAEIAKELETVSAKMTGT